MAKTVIHTNIMLHLPQLPPKLKNLRILHISDVHSRGINKPEQAVLQIAKQPCDLCLITGDNCSELRIPNPLYVAKCPKKRKPKQGLSWYGWYFKSKRAAALEFCRRLAENLNCPLRPFCISGNHDPIDMFEQLPGLGITTLNNQTEIIELPGRERINLLGLNCRRRETVDIPKTLAQTKPDIFSIAMLHYPELAQPLAAANVDMILAGHTHGGQVRTPWKTPLITHSQTGKYLNQSLNFINNTAVYTSRGLGESLIPLRINCPPEIITLTLCQGPRQNTKITTTKL